MTDARRTYLERRSYSARVMMWRREVYAKRAGLTAGCRVLLLRLSDDMDAKCIVSIPRSQLADEFSVAPARISEWIAQGKSHGFLDVVKRGRPGTTAVYQGIRPNREVRESVPMGDDLGVRETVPVLVREDVPQNGAEGYATAGTQEEVTPAWIEQTLGGDQGKKRSKERACEWCGYPSCDRTCLETQTEDDRRWTA